MKGLFVSEAGRLALGELAQPEPGPYEALVKTEACAICNSTDTKLIHGEFFLGSWPMLLGHETVGRIIAAGEGVQNFRVGQRVLHGTIASQRLGIPNGRSCWGGFAEYTLVTDVWARDKRAPGEAAHPQQVVPDEIDPVYATTLIMLKENLSLIGNSDVRGRTVAIVGTGPAAQAMALFARHAGAASVVVFGRRSRHRARIMALGADAYVADGVWPAAVDQAPAQGGFARVFEAVGSRGALARCLELVAGDGKVCVYGIPPESEPYTAQNKADPRVCWPKVAEAEVHDQMLGLVADGRVRLAEWVSNILPWQEFQQGFDLIWSKKANKVVLTFE